MEFDMHTNSPSDLPAPREGYVQIKEAQLYYREIGRGLPIIVLHGGPDFDQSYLLPDMDRLSRSFRLILILMNTAPASHDDIMLYRHERRNTMAEDLEKMKALSSTARYESGDFETDAEYYRIHFRATIQQPEHLERVIKSLR